jgi:hypothetical protein
MICGLGETDVLPAALQCSLTHDDYFKVMWGMLKVN